MKPLKEFFRNYKKQDKGPMKPRKIYDTPIKVHLTMMVKVQRL